MKSFTLTVQKKENSDECFVQFPDELMRELDWREGDTLSWDESNGGTKNSVSLVNISQAARKAAPPPELKLYEVHVLVSHRVRYAVKAASAEEAAAAVMNENCETAEFDQNCLGTQIVCSREVSMEQYLADPGHVGPEKYKLELIHNASQKA